MKKAEDIFRFFQGEVWGSEPQSDALTN